MTVEQLTRLNGLEQKFAALKGRVDFLELKVMALETEIKMFKSKYYKEDE